MAPKDASRRPSCAPKTCMFFFSVSFANKHALSPSCFGTKHCSLQPVTKQTPHHNKHTTQQTHNKPTQLTTYSPGFFSTRLNVCRGLMFMPRASRAFCRHVLSSLPPTGLRLMDLVST